LRAGGRLPAISWGSEGKSQGELEVEKEPESGAKREERGKEQKSGEDDDHQKANKRRARLDARRRARLFIRCGHRMGADEQNRRRDYDKKLSSKLSSRGNQTRLHSVEREIKRVHFD
jgi:hypothetical protein